MELENFFIIVKTVITIICKKCQNQQTYKFTDIDIQKFD